MTLISFTIGGTPYQAEEGMTWAEWCDSEYNTVSAYISVLDQGVWFPTGATLDSCHGRDEIINGMNYAFSQTSSGGSND